MCARNILEWSEMKVSVYWHFNDVVNKVTNTTRYFTTCKIMTRIQRARWWRTAVLYSRPASRTSPAWSVRSLALALSRWDSLDEYRRMSLYGFVLFCRFVVRCVCVCVHVQICSTIAPYGWFESYELVFLIKGMSVTVDCGGHVDSHTPFHFCSLAAISFAAIFCTTTFYITTISPSMERKKRAWISHKACLGICNAFWRNETGTGRNISFKRWQKKYFPLLSEAHGAHEARLKRQPHFCRCMLFRAAFSNYHLIAHYLQMNKTKKIVRQKGVYFVSCAHDKLAMPNNALLLAACCVNKYACDSSKTCNSLILKKLS